MNSQDVVAQRVSDFPSGASFPETCGRSIAKKQAIPAPNVLGDRPSGDVGEKKMARQRFHKRLFFNVEKYTRISFA
jgi:hypothetical protein